MLSQVLTSFCCCKIIPSFFRWKDEVRKRRREILHSFCKHQVCLGSSLEYFAIGKCVYISTWMSFYNIFGRASYHCIIQFAITPQTVMTLCQLWHSAYCEKLQSAVLKCIKALFLQILWSFQVNIFTKPKTSLQYFLDIFNIQFGHSNTKAKQSLPLNKIARTVWGNV